ncbi:MAG: hypothetical protein RLZZ428_78 [Pseudomonadota bacterium]|jgi:nucleoside phosphorylase
MIVCAGAMEQFKFATPIGIGLIDATLNLTKICMTHLPKSLLFVGTAGSYGDNNIFDILVSQTAVNIENSAMSEKSYTPISNKVSLNDSDVSRETVVNSSNYITADKEISGYYLDKGIAIENMEFYAVLKVAEAFDIPAKGVFIVTNYCDENGHNEFLVNHENAMAKITQYVKEQHLIESYNE